MYHQDGREITFHFGSAEDVTKATFSTGDNTGTFTYDDKAVAYTLGYVSGADTDTFNVPAQ